MKDWSNLEANAATEQKKISNSAFRVAVGSVFALVMGLLNQVLIAWFFGADVEMDAFFTAAVVPLYLQTVMIGGLAFVIIPAFVREETEGNPDDAWSLVGTFFWITAIILSLFALLGSIFARNIIEITTSGMPPDKANLAAEILAIMMFTVPLAGLSSLTSGIQNARDSFFWPSVANALSSVSSIVIIVTLRDFLGGHTLAWGYLIGAILSASITIVPVLRHRWKRLIPLSDPRLRELGLLVTPFILFGIFTNCWPLIERYFASGLADGTISYLGYAQKTGTIVAVVVGQGIVTAIYPAMARAFTAYGEPGLAQQTEYGLRLVLAMCLPAVAILATATVPLIGLLYERGNFEHTATLAISHVLPLYLLTEVLSFGVGNILIRSFYTTKDTYTVPIVSTIGSFVYFFVARALVAYQGYIGLGIAKVVASTFVITVLMLILLRRLPHFQQGALVKAALLYGTTSLVTLLGASLIGNNLPPLPYVVQLAVVGATGGLFYLAVLWRVDREITLAVIEMTGVAALSRRLGLLHFAETALRRES